MVGMWRTIYSWCGWDYPEKPTEETLRCRKEMLIQIRKSKLKLKPIVENNDKALEQKEPVKAKIKRKRKKKKKRQDSISSASGSEYQPLLDNIKAPLPLIRSESKYIQKKRLI